MNELRVPLDPMNPGQFFACCGLFDLLAHGDGDVLARFEADEAMPRRATFVVHGMNGELATVLKRLKDAKAIAVGPESLEQWNLWTGPNGSDRAAPEASILPVQLQVGGRLLLLDWWLNEFWDGTTNLKCWAGQVKSGTLISELLGIIEPDTQPKDLFTAKTMSKSKFGIDPRSAWNALDFGFSPNEHNKDAATYPIVEVLGALGLQSFRPSLSRRRSTYHLWLTDLPLIVARLAAFAPWSGLPSFGYQFSIDKRGQSYKFFSFADVQS
jgi:CRISPR-associated protein Csx14